MSERFAPGFGLAFDDLYARDGLVRLDGHFVAFLKARERRLARPADGRACRARGSSPASLSPNSSSSLRPSSRNSSPSCLESRTGSANSSPVTRALAPLYSVKRLFVQRRAAKKYSAEQAATLQCGRRAAPRARSADRRRTHRAHLRHAGRSLDAGRGRERRRARCGRALRRLGDAHARRPARAQGRRAVQASAQGRSAASRAGRDRGGRRRDHAQAAEVAAPRARRLRADRCRHRSHRRARPRQLLHLVPQPGQGFLLEGAARRRPASSRRARSASRSPAVRSTRRSPR